MGYVVLLLPPAALALLAALPGKTKLETVAIAVIAVVMVGSYVLLFSLGARAWCDSSVCPSGLVGVAAGAAKLAWVLTTATSIVWLVIRVFSRRAA